MDLAELGKRVKIARVQALKINQNEVAALLNSHQGIISRLEKGLGGSIELVLDFVELLEKNNFNGSLLFARKFSIDQLIGNYKPVKLNASNKILAEKFNELKKTIDKGHEQMMDMQTLFSPK